MFQLSVGKHDAKGQQQGGMVPEIAVLPYQYSRTYCVKVNNFSFHQAQKKSSSTYRHQDYSPKYSKNGR